MATQDNNNQSTHPSLAKAGAQLDEITILALATSEKEIIKIAKGNPGALAAIMTLMTNYTRIDPKAFFGPLHVLSFLEENKITSGAVWFTYKDICNQEPYKFIALMRGRQLGMIHEDLIKKLANQEKVTFNFAELVEKIRERIPFNTSI